MRNLKLNILMKYLFSCTLFQNFKKLEMEQTHLEEFNEFNEL